MQKLRVECFSISLDGYGAGPDQSLDNPLGVGGPELHNWFFPTDTFQKMHSAGKGELGVDNDIAIKGFKNIGAWIMGRNMFGPIRGEWVDGNWKGWWGDNPPYHCPVYVLTNHARESIKMEGGTTFHFITKGIEYALETAKISAEGKDIRLGGGVNTIQQYLTAKLIDEMHIAISPTILGSGEKLFGNINLRKLGYKCVNNICSGKAVHLIIQKE
jgi:dihydrofolate reductase